MPHEGLLTLDYKSKDEQLDERFRLSRAFTLSGVPRPPVDPHDEAILATKAKGDRVHVY